MVLKPSSQAQCGSLNESFDLCCMSLSMNVKCGYVSRCLSLHNSNFRMHRLGQKGSKKGMRVLRYDIIKEKPIKNIGNEDFLFKAIRKMFDLQRN